MLLNWSINETLNFPVYFSKPSRDGKDHEMECFNFIIILLHFFNYFHKIDGNKCKFCFSIKDYLFIFFSFFFFWNNRAFNWPPMILNNISPRHLNISVYDTRLFTFRLTEETPCCLATFNVKLIFWYTKELVVIL